MYQHIVVAVDDSACSTHTLVEAMRIARATGASLTLATVVNFLELAVEAGGRPDVSVLDVLAHARGSALLEPSLAHVAAEGLSATPVVLHSWGGGKEIAFALVEYAKTSGADLMVIGTHGRTGLRHLLLGSVAEAVMRESSLTTLVVRAPTVGGAAGG